MSEQAVAQGPGPIVVHERDSQQTVLPARSGELTPMAMISLAIEKDAPIERLEKLMDLQERWEANEARKAYFAAMSAFRANVPTITKNKRVTYTSNDGTSETDYRHASLDHICDSVNPALSEQGLSYHWDTKLENQVIYVTCVVTHIQGHTAETTLSSVADKSGGKNGIQAIGSAVTYLQRYTLLAALGLSTEDQDDDGAAAGERGPQNEAQPSGVVNDAQVKAIMRALESKGIPVEEFCRRYNIERVTQLGEERFELALNTINKATKRG